MYLSTRNANISLTASEVISKGISEEGGLFVPQYFPDITDYLINNKNIDYCTLAGKIMEKFLDDFTADEITESVKSAYSADKFGSIKPYAISSLSESDSINILELWHGPTCAFKDLALQLLPYLIKLSFKKVHEGYQALILVATSGDTGKAALEGFKNVEGTKIIVFYPQKGVSSMQQLQMLTQDGQNVTVCGVSGNFDDCQSEVKKIFTDGEYERLLRKEHYLLTSANSINWGRLMPQIVYYFAAYLDLLKSNKIDRFGNKVNIAVPTGNFGNILAAYYARKMGLPVNKLICASNSNNILTDFIKSGVYNVNRPFYTTLSPSMDILISSNLERLLFDLSDDPEYIKSIMSDLKMYKKFSVTDRILKEINSLVYSGYCNDEDTKKQIHHTFKKDNYLVDPHTAVSLKVVNDYFNDTGDIDTPVIVASTASPFKFPKAVLASLNEKASDNDFCDIDKISRLTSVEPPKRLTELKTKEIKFSYSSEPGELKDFINKRMKNW
jgi:threonine synthase